MASSETINTGKEKLNNWLHEKNYFTDVLDKVEKKTGVNRLYIFLGNSINFVTQTIRQVLIWEYSSSFRSGWSIWALSCVRLWSRSDRDSLGLCLSCLPIVSIL